MHAWYAVDTLRNQQPTAEWRCRKQVVAASLRSSFVCWRRDGHGGEHRDTVRDCYQLQRAYTRRPRLLLYRLSRGLLRTYGRRLRN